MLQPTYQSDAQNDIPIKKTADHHDRPSILSMDGNTEHPQNTGNGITSHEVSCEILAERGTVDERATVAERETVAKCETFAEHDLADTDETATDPGNDLDAFEDMHNTMIAFDQFDLENLIGQCIALILPAQAAAAEQGKQLHIALGEHHYRTVHILTEILICLLASKMGVQQVYVEAHPKEVECINRRFTPTILRHWEQANKDSQAEKVIHEDKNNLDNVVIAVDGADEKFCQKIIDAGSLYDKISVTAKCPKTLWSVFAGILPDMNVAGFDGALGTGTVPTTESELYHQREEYMTTKLLAHSGSVLTVNGAAHLPAYIADSTYTKHYHILPIYLTGAACDPVFVKQQSSFLAAIKCTEMRTARTVKHEQYVQENKIKTINLEMYKEALLRLATDANGCLNFLVFRQHVLLLDIVQQLGVHTISVANVSPATIAEQPTLFRGSTVIPAAAEKQHGQTYANKSTP